MNRKVLAAIVVTLTLSAAASAGTIGGKVSGVPTESVVYVEAIAGKTFQPPPPMPRWIRRLSYFSRAFSSYNKAQLWTSRTATPWRITSRGVRSEATRDWRTTWEPGRRERSVPSNLIMPERFL